MKKILFLILASSLSLIAGCQEEETDYTANFPDVSQIDATVSCDQATNIVTFTLNSTDLTPKWYFEDGTNSTETIVERLYPIAGDYQVDVKVMNKYGMSEEAKTYKFTVDNDYNGEKYELVWSDEFDGDALDQSVWHLEQGYLANNELQDYKTSGNHEVSNGSLKIIAKKVNDNKEFGSYTSARIISYYGGKSFTYGRIESRIKIPSGVGTWPAFWMLGDSLMEGGSWPSCGEIDIMEHVGYESEKIHATIHYNNSSGSYTSQTGSITIDSEDEWLIYGVIWTADGLQFYIDDPDNIYANYSAPATKTNWPFDEPQFLILNLAIGGDWGGAQGIDNTIFDATGSIQMEVDYVRVYDILY